MKKNLWIILAIGMVALFVGAGVLYSNLSKGFKPGGFQNQNTGLTDETENNTIEQAEVNTDANDATEETTQNTNDRMAPDITLEDLEGNKIKLSDFRGTPVVLNFWASWCPPCKSEMPGFEKLYKEHRDEVQFIMVNLTDGARETKDTAMAFIDSMGYTFPVYFDTDTSAALAYSAMTIPVTYLINADGTIAAYAMGAVEEDALEEGIAMILPQGE